MIGTPVFSDRTEFSVTTAHSSRRVAGDRHAPLQTHQHPGDIEPPGRGLGKTARRQRRRHRHSSALASFGAPTADMGPGKRFVQAYLDTIFRTFAFQFVPDVPVAVSGTVNKANGRPVAAGTEVTLQEEGTQFPTYSILGRLHRTVTNAKGQYTFYGNLTGTVTIQASGTSRTVTLPVATKIDVRLKK